jgi:MFS family permease
LIQGAGGGGFITSATGIVADTFPEARQRMIGFIVTTGTVGMVLGPNLGGWLTQSFGWRSLFWFNLPWGIAALLAGAVLLKKDGRMGKADFDYKGAGLLAASLGGLMVGLTSLGGEKVKTSWALVSGMLIVGSALMVAFVSHERRQKNPMVDFEILKGRPFAAANVYNTTLGFVFGTLTLLPLYAVTVYGASTVESGLIVTPRTAGMFLGSSVSSLLLVRWGYRKPMVVGTATLILGCALLGLESQGFRLLGVTLGGVGVMLAVVALTGLSQGFAVPAANNACIELMPDRISTITGIRATFRHVGQALGVAVASIVLDSFGGLNRGFVFVFFGTALLALATFPCIFAMPRSPSDVPASRH